MRVEQGKDGIWCASGNGNLRPIAAYSENRSEAMKMYAEGFLNQQHEEYAYQQSMGHLADINSPEGAYGVDEG